MKRNIKIITAAKQRDRVTNFSGESKVSKVSTKDNDDAKPITPILNLNKSNLQSEVSEELMLDTSESRTLFELQFKVFYVPHE